MQETGKTTPESIREAAARACPIDGRVRPFREIRRLHRQLDAIRETYKKLVYAPEGVSGAYEWLFDNYYILEREGRQVIRDLWRCRSLPAAGGEPTVRLHALRLCEAARGHIDAAAIENYIAAAQQTRAFETGELSAFGLLLRAALIEGAAEACGDVPEARRMLLLSDAVRTLNFLTTFDFSQIMERQSRLEQLLFRDPAGIYPKMDERSRVLYRTRLADIARRRRIPEAEAAERALALAEKGTDERTRHVGFYILEQELERPLARRRGRLYLILLPACPALLAMILWLALGGRPWFFWLPFLLYLPLWEILRPILDYFSLLGVPATFLPRLENKGTVPEEAPTLVVISVLLTSPQKAEEFAKRVEQFYYSNGRGNILFGILADLKEAKLPELPEDKAVRTAAVKAVRRLNRRYGGHFVLLLRSRRYSPTQGCFSGWERKRGAILELVRLIHGRQTSIETVEGDLEKLRKVRYLITLDADTGLVMDTAAEMVAAAMHPLNAPQVEDGVVTRGYGVLSPRISVELTAAGKTPFSRIMAGSGGVTAYDNASGDVYQDLFGEGIYAGKGILDAEAFYRVLDHALPEGRVLSHDILEGCFLRAGFLSDVELTDGFPPRPQPWFERLHRWLRGDWQNIGFLRKELPGGGESPFGSLSRFKLFDNLRRASTPVFSLLCLLAAAFCPAAPAAVLIAAAVLSVMGAGLWNAGLAVLRGGPSMLSRRYHCRVRPQAWNSLVQGVLGYLFLPHHAHVAADAALRAFRRLRSGKNLLEWTTAAEAEQKAARSGGFLPVLRRFWGTFVLGAAFLLLAPQPAAKAAGAFFLATPFLAWLSGRETQPPRDELTDGETEALRSYTAAMWRFYEDYVTAQDNFLPPDNMQEAPVFAVAHRTSPTNIGLLLLSTLAARDLGIIDSEALFERVGATLSTVEKLEKWRGHLYNWYDTRTLAPLRPAYISTVDSGNLLCCLTALREGLQDYRTESDQCAALCERIRRLCAETDLGALYNKRRRLFHIGYDVEKQTLSESYYDLLMSEARLTSYYAVARRLVPKRHWGALGRTLTRQNGYTGPVSWTGTMFEYLMPHLLLPVYEDSLSAEALRFVLACQKSRARGCGVPWGVSESGFYSFDAALNYQYEAHGVQRLALKRGMDGDLVVSPYSTFLALPFDRQGGMRNLRALEALDMTGRCGFFEAADFTYRRTGGRMAVVKSYMAHHVGMSIVAADNALSDGVMQDRFMRDQEMRAARDLLQEKIPDAVVFHDVLRRDPPEKPGRYGAGREEFETVNPAGPRVCAVGNGEYTMLLTDCGASLSLFRGVDLTRRGTDLLRAPTGVFAAAKFGDEFLCATAAPRYENGRLLRRRVEFDAHGAVWRARAGAYGIEMQALLHGGLPCEARHVELWNDSQRRVETSLLFYFEPCLAKAADEAAHPAFSHLFLSASYRPDTKILLFTRRTRGTDLPVCVAAGFLELDEDFDFEGDRGSLLRRPEGIASLPGAFDAPFGGRTGALPDAAAALRLRFTLPPRGRKAVTLLLAAAGSAEEAVARLIEARREGWHGMARAAAPRDAGDMENRLAALVLPQVLFPVRDGRDMDEAVRKNRLGQQGLWSLGISGDFPILLFHCETETSLERLEPYVKMHRALRLKSVQADLVITCREGGDYSRSLSGAIRSCVRRCGSEYLLGGRGGVHLVNLDQHPEETRILLLSCACHVADGTLRSRPVTPYALAPAAAPEPLSDGPAGETPEGSDTDAGNPGAPGIVKTVVLGVPASARTGKGDMELGGTLQSAPSAPSSEAESSNNIHLENSDTRGTDPAADTGSGNLSGTDAQSSVRGEMGNAPHQGTGDLAGGLATFAGRFVGETFVIPHGAEEPPAPWCHILAGDSFGTLLSDRALGFTWAVNARENKLTPWSNDTAADNRGEQLLVRIGGRTYDACLNARVTYGPGYALYESRAGGLELRVRVTVPAAGMAKLAELTLNNPGGRETPIEAAYYTEPVLGVGPSTRRHIIITRRENVVLLRNPWSQVSGCAFLTVQEGIGAFVWNRANFLAGLWKNAEQGQEKGKAPNTGSDFSPDPCAAVVARATLPAGGSAVLHFALGFAASEEAALKTAALVQHPAPAPLTRSALQIKTPDPRLDVLFNHWLLPQVLGSRIRGRTGFYQCGGAWGFRDQLQDACAALYADPAVTRAHIFRCAAHQFREGDVMHWWHQLPPRDGGARGVRTRCSDDMLWLPYAVCEYVEKTGDDGILRREIFYLDGPELDRSEEDRYFAPARSGEKENLYGHCVRAVARGLTKGPHGLPLFGSGDWNDGMNLVGLGGKGESVWLALFLALVLDKFAPLCRLMGDEGRAAEYGRESARLRAAVDKHCWNGEWYARGFYDDGRPLGVREESECRIDILPQSFASLSGMPDESRRKAALDSAMRLLVDDRLRLTRLFTPAFDQGGQNPGYIRSYPPGIRENGGQYTHGAVWGALGLLAAGRPEDALRILEYINPARRTEKPEPALTYRLEPYALAADIYTNPACEGRGGWSLYTGAAGWYYRTVAEALLGIRITATAVSLAPCLPAGWPGYEASLCWRGTRVHIAVRRGEPKGLAVDGAPAEAVPLDGREHEAVLNI